MKTIVRCYRVDRRQISFVKFILEAYDNVAVVSTLDPTTALVQITIAPGCESLVTRIMGSLADDFAVAAVDPPISTGLWMNPPALPEEGSTGH
ncbi:DUF4911 domain-containing protein [Desulfosarcina ovata]|nr:DUF4911 domain-containing protein [Desulfosarcina ovata]